MLGLLEVEVGVVCRVTFTGTPKISHRYFTSLNVRDCTVSLTGETSVTGEIGKFHRCHR